jgi:MoxR-like ATPase
MLKFYVCSVGDPAKNYAKENLDRIVNNSAFILHQDAKQKGVYEEIAPGSIVLLKFDRRLIAYGKSIQNRITNEDEWNLWTDVREWYFKNPDNIEEGIPLYGIAADTIAGGAYGTVKEVSSKFGWQKLQEINSTTSLHSEIKQLLSLMSPTNEMQEIINLLKYKKQIILQGPPGTGKTYTAKEIARQLVSTDSGGFQVLPYADDVKTLLSRGERVPMRNSDKSIQVADLSDTSVKVSYREGKFFSLKFNRIASCIASGNFTRKGGDAYLHALAEHVLKKWIANKKGGEYIEASASQIQLIQFHPAYSYEDFVRGITAKTSGSSVEYRTENRILAEFANQALENFENSQKETSTLSKEIWIKEQVGLFADTVQEIIDRNGKYPINEKVSIFEVDRDAFRYVGDSWAIDNKQRMKFSDLIISYLHNAKSRQDIKAIDEVSGRAKQHASYDFKVLEKFRALLPKEPIFENSSTQVDEKQYVLIIDEINRANLPTVLGELIYALEYRGEPVEGTYDIDGDRTLVLPPNLYIIGTMNTADRSVGHIDYAIRRRFAFVDVLPSPAPVHSAAKNLFKQVSELFVSNYDLIDWLDPNPIRSEYVAADFHPEDIWIGHSYFMSDKQDEEDAKADLEIRLKYEILPLLKEYVKDGLLLPEAEEKIKKLHV